VDEILAREDTKRVCGVELSASAAACAAAPVGGVAAANWRKIQK
jgi:hypothetical protein